MKLPDLSINRRENEIIRGIEDHLAIVRSTVTSFAGLLDAVAAGDEAGSADLLSQVHKGAHESGQLRRDLSMKIAEGAFFGGIREDMLHLLARDDAIAVSAKDASRFLGLEGGLDKNAVSLLGSATMKRFMEDQVSAVSSLQEIVAAFKLDKKEILARMHKVKEFELAADSEKEALYREIFTDAKRSNPVTVIQMRDFVFAADNIADNAEQASNVVLVLVAKGYG